ncbi:MAG: hypothetical protein HFI38_09860 [Lachnospiraceae bacterium]|nr:hypothetical protein [Lachnospiraceae bacterium]
MIDNSRTMKESNVVSVNKLIANIKSYWWVCLICMICGILITVRSTLQEYKNNLALASQNFYVSGADFFLDCDVNMDGSVWTVILSSHLVREKTEDKLRDQFQDTLQDGDRYFIQEKGGSSCLGVTVIGEGRDHTLFLAQAVAAAFEEAINECTSVTMRTIDAATVANPCVVLQNGGILTFTREEDRNVSLSLRDFVSWKKAMTIMAFAFAGLGAIFILILFDNKIRGKEEAEVICNKACIADLRRKGDSATIAIKLNHLLFGDDESRIVLATLNDGDGFEKVLPLLNKEITERMIQADSICRNADGLLVCSNQEKVVLIVKQDKDTVGLLKEAMRNIELVSGILAGYILV